MRVFRFAICVAILIIGASPILAKTKSKYAFDFSKDPDFFFGVATAPGHVEDQLDDIWLNFAREGKVVGFDQVGQAEERLRFFTAPEEEIRLAKELGIKAYRMGVDWARLAPHLPGSYQCNGICPDGVQDWDALERYREIIQMVRDNGMDVILTLQHHAVPGWLLTRGKNGAFSSNKGGWVNPESIKYFLAYTRDVVKYLSRDVDHWVLFNEPSLYAAFTWGFGIWPPGNGTDLTSVINTGFYKGSMLAAIDNMIEAHKLAYRIVKKEDKDTVKDPKIFSQGPASVGIAHNIAKYKGQNPWDSIPARLAHKVMNYRFTDGIQNHVDFIGLNYYGEERVTNASLRLRKDLEYSEAGRTINPNGFYELLKDLNKRYNKKRSQKIPFFITENGISDSTDKLRPLYIVEHLVALQRAIDEGVPVKGYIHWTVSDNWEWADGYCPKFGLVAVDRWDENLRRTPRESYKLYSKISRDKSMSEEERAKIYKAFRANIGSKRFMCRDKNGQTALGTPEETVIKNIDWRFRD